MTYTQAEQNLIILDGFADLTYKDKRELLSGLSSHLPNFEKVTKNLIKKEQASIYNKVEKQFFNAEYRQKTLSLLDKKGVIAVTYFSKHYPKQLKQIPSPPLVLYCKGNVKLLAGELFAMVGSRSTPASALKACALTAEKLSKYFTLVTGLADGVDTAVAQGAVKNGRVICVLAYGFDYVYPAVNAALLSAVQQNGLVLSEHRPEVEPRLYLFPPRNRIIAALGKGVLIASAGQKSGALITADYAKQYQKTVFAFPYNVGTLCGVGCNALIKQGALLCEGAQDIFQFYHIQAQTQNLPPLTENEQAIYDIICKLGDAHVEQIAAEVGRAPFLLISDLTSLEIKKRIVKLGGNRYAPLTVD